jgi:hypothetical protein
MTAGNKYFLLIVDDFSRYMWVVLLKRKDQALQAFWIMKMASEVEAEAKLKALRTDRGVSSSLMNLRCFVKLMGSSGTSPHHIHRSKTVLWKGGTKPWWPWHAA